MDAPASTAKRKRPATDIVDEVSDADVEEFYEILRRMRDASRRLCPGPPRAPVWRPSFSWEDFEPAPAPAPATTPPSVDERVAENATPTRRPPLDLNSEPEPEASPATPRATA